MRCNLLIRIITQSIYKYCPFEQVVHEYQVKIENRFQFNLIHVLFCYTP